MSDKKKVEVTDSRDGPGVILRKAREAKGLEVPAVAAMLHLSERKLNALETDDFDVLPEPVFIRGYLKNYARLLEEPITPILDAYARSNSGAEIGEQPPLDSHVAEEVGIGHGVVRMVTLVVIVAVFVLPLIWWWDYLELAAQKIVGKGVQEIDQEMQTPEVTNSEADLSAFMPPPPPGSVESGATGEPPATGDNNERVTATLDPKPRVDQVEPVITEQSATTAGGMPIPILPKPEVAEVIEPVPEPKPATMADAPAPKPAVSAPASKGTVFEFVESSWVKVRDVDDQVILIGEYKKGETKKLPGKMPYKVVLGNSPAVRVKIDGNPVDLDKFSSGGVARFTIKGGKIENP